MIDEKNLNYKKMKNRITTTVTLITGVLQFKNTTNVTTDLNG